MRWIVLIPSITLFFCTFFPGVLKAQISVNLTNQPEGETQSGTTHTLVLNIKNTAKDTAMLSFAHNVPPPLRALVFSNKITVLPETFKNVLIPISIPRHAKAGSYDLTFVIRQHGSIISQVKTTFIVPKRIDIRVDLISKPPYARANDTIRAEFLISNNGNDREVLLLRSRNCMIRGNNTVSIPTDSTLIISVEMIPDQTLLRIEDKAIDLSAAILGAERSESDQEIIRIYPIRTRQIDPYFRYPISFRSNYVYRTSNGEGIMNGYQYQISGRGAIDVKKKHHILFDYRGPGDVRVTRLGNFAQKYVQYYSERMDIFVGEKSFGLSNLTENFRFGTGVDVNAKINNHLKIGAYYNKPLMQPEFSHQLAGYAMYETSKKYMYRFNTIQSVLRDGTPLSLASIQTSWSDYNSWAFNTEIARSFGSGAHGNAYTFEGNLDLKGFKISSTGLYADQNYKGYSSNSMFLNGSIGYNLRKIGFQISGNFNDENPNLDTVFSAAPYSIFLNAGLVGRFTKSWNLQLISLYRQKVDRLSTKRFDYEERRIRFASIYRLGDWSGRLLAEGGITRNLLVVNPEHQSSFGYDAQIQLGYSPGKKISIGTFSQFLSNTRFSQQRTSYFLFGGDVRYKLHRDVFFEFEYQNNYLIEDLYNDRNLINFRGDFTFKRNHNLSMLVNYGILHQSPIRRDWFYTASYSFKLGVPLKKMMSLGSVEGQIINQGVSSVTKVVLMMDGQLETTDEQGKFKFNNLKPGTHQLFIDKRSIGVRDIPDVQLPLEVEVLPDKTQKISFALTRSSAIRGKLNMMKVKVVQSSKEKILQPKVIVEASNGTESVLTQTDADGNFLFGSLKPGTWTLRLVPGSWKDQFYIREGEVVISVQPDGEATVSFLIEPKVRQIKFLTPTSIKKGE